MENEIKEILDWKVSTSKTPWQTLQLDYGSNRGKAYTDEEDRFLVCLMQKVGYGRWEEIKLEIRKAWQFRFDWFIKSRTPQELNRRGDLLVRLIRNERDSDETSNKRKKSQSSSSKKKQKTVDDDGDYEEEDAWMNSAPLQYIVQQAKSQTSVEKRLLRPSVLKSYDKLT